MGEATLEAAEREHIIRVLRETGGVIGDLTALPRVSEFHGPP